MWNVLIYCSALFLLWDKRMMRGLSQAISAALICNIFLCNPWNIILTLKKTKQLWSQVHSPNLQSIQTFYACSSAATAAYSETACACACPSDGLWRSLTSQSCAWARPQELSQWQPLILYSKPFLVLWNSLQQWLSGDQQGLELMLNSDQRVVTVLSPLKSQNEIYWV